MADRVGVTIGQKLGNYRLFQLLGQGGQASVYLGKHVQLQTPGSLPTWHIRILCMSWSSTSKKIPLTWS